MNNKKNKIINSFAIAAVVAIVFVTTATIIAELYTPFKDWLKNTFYHHWMGKGIIAIVIFYAIGFIGIIKASDSEDVVTRMLKIVFWVAVVGVLAITGFYSYEYFIVAH